MEQKVWIFASTQQLKPTIQSQILAILNHFLAGWKAHGKQLEATSQILENHFIKITVYPTTEQASGCSIDALVKQIQAIEQQFGLTLLDRMNVFYKDHQTIRHEKLPTFKQKIKSGEIKKTFYIYNTSINTENNFANQWLQPITQSWAKDL